MANTRISALTSATTPLAGTEVLPIVQSSTTVKVATNDLTVRNVRAAATTGILQVSGPTAGTTRTMTTPDANFTAARTDAAQSFSGLQTFGSGVSVTSGKVTSVYGAGGDFVALFQNTTSGTPYGVWIKDASGPTAGYPLLNISDSAGTSTYLRVDSSNGNTTVGIGNLVIGTSGKGIDFSATSGTGTSELLADYEEGTWTPVVTGTGTAGTYQIGTNGSTYTKIGRMVTLQGYIQFAAVVTGGGTGSLQITGLPFSKTANSYPAGSVYLATGTYTGIDPIVVFGSFSASSQLLLQQNASGGFGTAVVIGFASANAYLAFTLSYEV